jgi:hypothetical protein
MPAEERGRAVEDAAGVKGRGEAEGKGRGAGGEALQAAVAGLAR